MPGGRRAHRDGRAPNGEVRHAPAGGTSEGVSGRCFLADRPGTGPRGTFHGGTRMRTAPTPAAVLIAVVAVLGPAAPAAAAQVTGSSPVHRPVLAPALAADGARTGGATDADLAIGGGLLAAGVVSGGLLWWRGRSGRRT
ncbi:hypothetical protein EF917_23515 [Streptomyces sp. WAC00469]|nr:hypothetical protein EF917_23515 [Streptomyces sp. WAC00469]